MIFKNKASKFVFILVLAGAFAAPAGLSAESVAEKAMFKRNELLMYLRQMRPMVYNFPCEPFPECTKDDKKATERIQEYTAIKRTYQQGIIYYFERNFLNAYLRFLDAQRRTERLMEDISQSYVLRTELMLRDALEQKDPNDPDDMSLVDISIEFGPNSKMRRDFQFNREAPNETRRYRTTVTHYAFNKYRIEKNMEMGYYQLGLAKLARQRALTVDRNLAPHQKLTPNHRRDRIEYYLDVVTLCRRAKYNAEFIFQMKYPYDRYPMANLPSPALVRDKDGNLQLVDKNIEDMNQDKVPALEGHKMNWQKNPYYLPKKMHPIFDLSLPAAYRRDASDVRQMVFGDEVDMTIKFKYHKKDAKPTTVIESKDDGKKDGN